MKLTFPVLKLQFLGAQHIHASRGIWEARDSSVIQNGLCLGLNGPISKIFTRMMNMGYWRILSEDVRSYPSFFSFILLLSFVTVLFFLRGAKTWRGTKIFLRVSETQRSTGPVADGSTWRKDGHKFNQIRDKLYTLIQVEYVLHIAM